MAEIFSLRPSEHETVQQLLPWHINATLSADETARVEAHLAVCAECREDLAAEREMAREIALLPLDVDEGWRGMTMRMGSREADNDAGPDSLLRRKVPMGWAMGGAIAASMTLAVAVVGLQQFSAPDHAFRTLGSASSVVHAQAVVLFQPDTTSQQMRAILSAQGASVIDGPTAAGAYVLRFDHDATVSIDALRQSSEVVLAEPIASDGRP